MQLIVMSAQKKKLLKLFLFPFHGFANYFSEEGKPAPSSLCHALKAASRHLEIINFMNLTILLKDILMLLLKKSEFFFADRVNCSIVAVHNALKRLEWRYKKNRYMRVNKAEKT